MAASILILIIVFSLVLVPFTLIELLLKRNKKELEDMGISIRRISR